MGREEFEVLKGGVLKRRGHRKIGLFIDGTGLDRATRRLERKVDMARLVSGLTSGLEPEIARYYTLVPYEDDARQFAFLDAVERAGLEVIIKRLPPKGVKRQVSMDVHIATDIISYSLGVFEHKTNIAVSNQVAADTCGGTVTKDAGPSNPLIHIFDPDPATKRLITVVCPSRELSYSIYMSHQLGIETTLADFGLYGASEGWKGVDRWVDLSTSETIWRD